MRVVRQPRLRSRTFDRCMYRAARCRVGTLLVPVSPTLSSTLPAFGDVFFSTYLGVAQRRLDVPLPPAVRTYHIRHLYTRFAQARKSRFARMLHSTVITIAIIHLIRNVPIPRKRVPSATLPRRKQQGFQESEALGHIFQSVRPLVHKRALSYPGASHN